MGSTSGGPRAGPVDEQDPAVVESVAENVTGIVVPQCGHFIPEEQPARLAELVL